MSRYFILITFLFLGFGCSETKQTTEPYKTRFQLIDNETSGLDFSNTITESQKIHVGMYEYLYNGSGVAIGDINNDGLEDIFLTGNMVPNKLFINKGDLKFEDVSAKAGIQNNTWSTGVTMVDINDDGWLDIYVCNSGPYVQEDLRTNQLFINNGDLSFTEAGESYGINDTNKSTMASFFDYDKDGDQDLFVLNHSPLLQETSGSFFEKIEDVADADLPYHSCKFFRNDGGKFTDISKEAGILKPAFGLGLITTDLNDDGWVDIYVANDFFIPDFMFINDGKGGFVDQIKEKTGHVPFFSMGCDAADFNNDGLVDIVSLDMTPEDHYRSKMLMASMNVNEFRYLSGNKGYQSAYMRNALQLNNGFGIFSEIGSMSGIAKTDWSWAAVFSDLDNDSWKDLVITNGFKRDTKNNDWANQVNSYRDEHGGNIDNDTYWEFLKDAESNPIQNYLYQNQGDFGFKNVAQKWGFGEETFSCGMAVADLDKDGDLEMVLSNIDDQVYLYKNYSRENDNSTFFRIKLTDQGSTDKALNAKVTIKYGDKLQYADNTFVRGYQSTMEPIIHFGLGNQTEIDELTIEWPDGQVTSIPDPSINTEMTVEKTKSALKPKTPLALNLAFQDITRMQNGVSFYHDENDFDDFAREILLPHQYSTMGPFLSVGDVDGNGLDDFFVGGASGQAGELYVQDENMRFSKKNISAFASDRLCEDMGSALFDADNDGDIDLYVAGGAGEFVQGSRELADRLYLNDGAGNFTKSSGRIPSIQTSSGRVLPADYDGDGWTDLFVCGRNNPGKYPYPGHSYLLKNEKGKFTIQNDLFEKDLSSLGMVTDASWVDYDGDGDLDITIVGEWMPIRFFENTAKGFVENTEEFGLEKEVGWWRSISTSDFDNDGDMDFVVGNIGSNNKFKPSDSKPLHVFCNDFDDNGTLDIVLSNSYNNALVPVRGKECSTEQMPFLAEKFKTYDAFSSSNLEEIYTAEKLSGALHYEATIFESVYLENKDGGFVLSKLNKNAQMAPVNGIVVSDFDNDGNDDLVTAGNLFQTEVETPRYDAGKGLYMKGMGDGEFQSSPKLQDNGLFIPGDAKDLKLIHLGPNKIKTILATNNNSILQFFMYRNQIPQ